MVSHRADMAPLRCIVQGRCRSRRRAGIRGGASAGAPSRVGRRRRRLVWRACGVNVRLSYGVGGWTRIWLGTTTGHTPAGGWKRMSGRITPRGSKARSTRSESPAGVAPPIVVSPLPSRLVSSARSGWSLVSSSHGRRCRRWCSSSAERRKKNNQRPLDDQRTTTRRERPSHTHTVDGGVVPSPVQAGCGSTGGAPLVGCWWSRVL